MQKSGIYFVSKVSKLEKKGLVLYFFPKSEGWFFIRLFFIGPYCGKQSELKFFAETEVFYVVDTKILPGFEDEKVYPCEVCSEELFLTDKIFNLHTT